MSEIAEKGLDFARDLGDAARRNPISAVLIGMAALWLFAGGQLSSGPQILCATPVLTAFPMRLAMRSMPPVHPYGQAPVRSANGLRLRPERFARMVRPN